MDDPLTPAEYEAREQRMADAEKQYVATMLKFREDLMAALGRGELSITYTLPTMRWLDILDEIQDRRPRGFSMLLRDDLFDRLGAAIDRIHEEVNYMVAVGPSPSVAARQDERRIVHGRQAASPELRAMLKKKP